MGLFCILESILSRIIKVTQGYSLVSEQRPPNFSLLMFIGMSAVNKKEQVGWSWRKHSWALDSSTG